MLAFTGFPQDALAFLVELKANNRRDWFEHHRERYEDSVRTPALAFIEAVGAHLPRISKHFLAIPKKAGGSLMRIHRDVRFSADKSPYKTNIGIHFRHAAGCDVHAPGLYVHLDPEEAFVGAGIWHPPPEALRQVRTAIQDRPAAWKKIRNDRQLLQRFTFAGDSNVRPPAGVAKDHPLIEDIKRKDFLVLQSLKPRQFFSPGLVQETVQAFENARPLLRFLCDALGQPF